MVSSASAQGTGPGDKPSTLNLVKRLARLTPRQLRDEVDLAVAQMKRKGIQAGVASAILVVALVFVAFLLTALIVAAIMGLATVMPAWLAALLVAAAFLLLALIGALVGMSRLKKALPLVPQDAIRGVRYDVGVLREGHRFNPNSLDVRKPKPAKAAGTEPGAGRPKEPQPSYGELRNRADGRRENLATIRDGLAVRLDLKTRIKALLASASAWINVRTVRAKTAVAKATVARPAASKANASKSAALHAKTSHATASDRIKDRWQPLTVLAASLGTAVVLLRKLVRK